MAALSTAFFWLSACRQHLPHCFILNTFPSSWHKTVQLVISLILSVWTRERQRVSHSIQVPHGREAFPSSVLGGKLFAGADPFHSSIRVQKIKKNTNWTRALKVKVNKSGKMSSKTLAKSIIFWANEAVARDFKMVWHYRTFAGTKCHLYYTIYSGQKSWDTSFYLNQGLASWLYFQLNNDILYFQLCVWRRAICVPAWLDVQCTKEGPRDWMGLVSKHLRDLAAPH